MVDIETSQHVELKYEPAGIIERVFAFLIDGLLLGAYYITAVGLLDYFSPSDNAGAGIPPWILILLITIPMFLYHLIIEIFWDGYSVGKKIFGLRVVKRDGSRADLSGYFLRWIFRLFEITMTSGVVAFITVLINGKGQRLGDIAGNTCVIKERKKVSLEDTLYSFEKSDEELNYSGVAELSDEDIRVIRKVIKSRDTYDHRKWEELMQRAASKMEKRLGVDKGDKTAENFLKQILKDYTAIHSGQD